MTGRFAEPAMWSAMREIARRLDLPDRDARLLRMTNNAVFALADAGVVIRVARSSALRERAYKIVELGRWFADCDAPTIRLAPGVQQPVVVGELLATIWRYQPSSEPAPTVYDLARCLRQFHELGMSPFPVPEWDPVGDAVRRLALADGLGDRDRSDLAAWCGRLAPQVAALRSPGSGLVHGDAHAGNLIRASSGRVLWCDFDATCRGPWQVDLVPAAVGEARFGRTGEHRALADGYGYDVMDDPAWPVLRAARELKMICAVLPYLSSTSGVAEEFALRLRSVVDGDHTIRWTPFVNLTA